MLSPPKATSLLALLVAATACGTPDAAPGPTPTFPLTATSSQASAPPVPSNNTISVQPTTSVEPTVEATTEPPPPASTETPPPAPPPPVPTPGEPPAPPTEEPPGGLFVLQGTACPAAGAIAVNRRFKPMVCTAEGDKLRWQPA